MSIGPRGVPGGLLLQGLLLGGLLLGGLLFGGLLLGDPLLLDLLRVLFLGDLLFRGRLLPGLLLGGLLLGGPLLGGLLFCLPRLLLPEVGTRFLDLLRPLQSQILQLLDHMCIRCLRLCLMFLPEGTDQELGQDLGQFLLPDLRYQRHRPLLLPQGLRTVLPQGVSRMEELQFPRSEQEEGEEEMKRGILNEEAL